MYESKKINIIDTVIVKIQSEKYLLEVKNVKEIYVPGDKIVPIPLADKTLVGVINIRGEIYTIISLRHKIYHSEITYGLGDHTRILLLELKNLKIALLVDSVIGVRKFPISMFETQSAIIETDIDYQYIKSIGVIDDETYILLDLDTLIPPIFDNITEQPVYLPRTKVKALSMDKPSHELPAEIELPRLPQQNISNTIVKLIKSKKVKSISEFEISLSDYQKDTLREIGNIGSGNAVTALSRLIKKKINVDLTNVGIVKFDQLADELGGQDVKICGIFSNIKPPSKSTILQAFELTPLMRLVASLARNKSKIDPNNVKSKGDLDDFAISTIEEMGNIMAGHYVSALADLTGMKMMIDTPEFAMSEAGLLKDFLAQELQTITPYIIIIKTSIRIVDLKLNGIFFFIPDITTLYTMFDKLQVEYEPLVKIEKPKELDLRKLDLTEVQRDALQEIGNMGAGNAANALAKMINKRVDINIPSVEMVELDEFAKRLSQKKEKLFVSWSNVTGKTRATVLSIFNVNDIISLTSILVDDLEKKLINVRKTINEVDDFPELYKDAMKELGHIMASHYVNALGDLLSIRLMTEPPDISVDTSKQLFAILKEEIGLLKKLSLVITTNVIITDFKIVGTFLFIPNLETLQELLAALAKFYE